MGLVFNGMEMAFLYRLRPLARDNALYGADASVRARDKGDGMECSGKGRRGTRWHRGDVKKVRVWLQRCYCSPLRYRNSHWQFLQIRNNGANGQSGSNGANGRCGVYGRDGRIWLIDRWLWLGEGLKLQEIGN